MQRLKFYRLHSQMIIFNSKGNKALIGLDTKCKASLWTHMESIWVISVKKGNDLNLCLHTFTNRNEFIIAIALKHILGLIKICDLVEGKFLSAMELVDENACVCFLFTNSAHKDFKFCIGMANVKFQTICEAE